MQIKTTAVIVARKGSVRVPGKMFQPIAGESLIMRKINQLRRVEEVSEIIVCTDAEDIAHEITAAGAKFCLPPEILCQGRPDKVNEMVRNALSFFESDQVLWAHCTNPFITDHHYTDALYTLSHERKSGYDSLFSVNRLTGHFWNKEGSPINFAAFDPQHKIAAHLPPVYAQNGGIFIRPYEDMKKDGCLIAGKAYMFAMDQLSGWDIDLPWQMEFAQQYAKTYDNRNEGIFE